MQNNDVQKQDGLHRTNRILMIIISLLLALVLITTCVLSGAYARYITRKTVGTTITFKKLDMSVDIIVSDDLEAYITTGGDEDTFSASRKVKGLIAELKKEKPNVENNIFQSIHNVQLDTLVSYKQDGEKHSFLEKLGLIEE